MQSLTKPHLFGVIAGLFLAAGLVASAMVATRAWVRIAESQTVTVTGSARRAVTSDLVVWRGSFAVEAKTLLEAQRALKADLAKVEAFLKTAGVTNHGVSTISIQEIRARAKGDADSNEQRTVGYRLGQSVEVQTEDVAKADKLSTDSASLVEQGVAFTTSPVEYIYTKAGEAKVEMLGEATKDALARAEQIAGTGGRKVDQLRAAKMGVFQITPQHAIKVSWDGENDVSSLDKTITAVVNATFSLK
ncbi:MAG: SIMPL domain-containing protein [Verrucomicrobia bacterium]|nr:SIMPL domain-containing protein [Verrucomicrobiota bacterium]